MRVLRVLATSHTRATSVVQSELVGRHEYLPPSQNCPGARLALHVSSQPHDQVSPEQVLLLRDRCSAILLYLESSHSLSLDHTRHTGTRSHPLKHERARFCGLSSFARVCGRASRPSISDLVLSFPSPPDTRSGRPSGSPGKRPRSNILTWGRQLPLWTQVKRFV